MGRRKGQTNGSMNAELAVMKFFTDLGAGVYTGTTKRGGGGAVGIVRNGVEALMGVSYCNKFLYKVIHELRNKGFAVELVIDHDFERTPPEKQGYVWQGSAQDKADWDELRTRQVRGWERTSAKVDEVESVRLGISSGRARIAMPTPAAMPQHKTLNAGHSTPGYTTVTPADPKAARRERLKAQRVKIEAEIKRDASQSNREIARKLGSDHHTVANVRKRGA